jgi:hypothetical protein
MANRSTYGTLTDFMSKDDSMRGDGGRGLLKVITMDTLIVCAHISI